MISGPLPINHYSSHGQWRKRGGEGRAHRWHKKNPLFWTLLPSYYIEYGLFLFFLPPQPDLPVLLQIIVKSVRTLDAIGHFGSSHVSVFVHITRSSSFLGLILRAPIVVVLGFVMTYTAGNKRTWVCISMYSRSKLLLCLGVLHTYLGLSLTYIHSNVYIRPPPFEALPHALQP